MLASLGSSAWRRPPPAPWPPSPGPSARGRAPPPARLLVSVRAPLAVIIPNFRSFEVVSFVDLDAVMDAGCGLGIACSMPSYGMGNEKHELGLAVASAPAATITPVLSRYARGLTGPLELLLFNEISSLFSRSGHGLARCEDQSLTLSMWL